VVDKDVNNGPLESEFQLAVATNVVKNNTALTNLVNSLKVAGFILAIEDGAAQAPSYDGLSLVFKAMFDNKTALLLRKVRDQSTLVDY